MEKTKKEESTEELVEKEIVIIPETTEESVVINDGAEGDAGQVDVNDIDVVDEEYVVAGEDVYVNSYIKLSNALIDLKEIRENDISIEKNENLDVAILYTEEAIKAIEKLKK